MPMQVDELTLMKDMTIEGKKVCYFDELDNNAVTAEMLRNDMVGRSTYPNSVIRLIMRP